MPRVRLAVGLVLFIGAVVYLSSLSPKSSTSTPIAKPDVATVEFPTKEDCGDARTLTVDLDRGFNAHSNFRANIEDRIPASGRQYLGLMRKAARRHGVGVRLLVAIVWAETDSNFDPDLVSPSGAQGLGQLMPPIAASLGVDDPFDPEQNLDGSAAFLSSLTDRFGGNKAKVTAGYYAGPFAVMEAVTECNGVPSYSERYVRKVLRNYRALSK